MKCCFNNLSNFIYLQGFDYFYTKVLGSRTHQYKRITKYYHLKLTMFSKNKPILSR